LDWLRIRLYDLFCLLSIMLFQPHNLEIVLNGLTWADSSCLLCHFFHCIFFFQFHHSISIRLGIELYNVFFICFLWGYLGLTTKVTSFGVLTLVKSCYVLVFFLRDYLSLIIWVTGPSTLYLLFIRLSPSHDPSHRFGWLTQLT
jgi:hypothetical protein